MLMIRAKTEIMQQIKRKSSRVIDDTDTTSEPPPGRWDEEKEMDTKLRIAKRKQEATLRLRKINQVADRLLMGKIQILETDFRRQSRELQKEARNLKQEFEDYEPSVLQLPHLNTSSSSLVASRSGSRAGGGSRPGTRESTCHSCIFGTPSGPGKCKHFPCFLPSTYNSLRVDTRPKTYSVLSNYDQLMKRCRGLRPMTSQVQLNSKEDVGDSAESSRAPRVSIREKERGLKQLVKEMKERNEKRKPRDWAVNYGDPVRPRVLLKPVVPCSNSIF